ncbi:hypothetical protein OB905_11660 [Halobacteria archaeon AArc-dxtr1]|nr:hypothetical protein [Halobacteria archaeon AArc-dxtr1]
MDVASLPGPRQLWTALAVFAALLVFQLLVRGEVTIVVAAVAALGYVAVATAVERSDSGR